MKRFVLTCCILLFASVLFAQNPTLNRLKYQLRTATDDITQLKVLDSLSMYNLFFYHAADSTYIYCKEYISKALQQPDKKYLILAYQRLGFYYFNVSQFKESLSVALKGLDLAEQYHNQDYLSALYYDITWCYANLNENNEALKNALLGVSHLKQDKDPFYDEKLHLYGLTGLCYQDVGKADSAVFYYKKMSMAASSSKELSAKVIADFHWSIYYLNDTKDYKKTDSVIADGIKECLRTGDFLLQSLYNDAATSALAQNNTNKAIAQAKIGMKLSEMIEFPQGVSSAAGLLESIYERTGKQDSAFFYLKMEDSLNTVVQNHSNTLDVEQFEFNHELNKKEQAAAEAILQQKQWTKTLTYVFATAVAFLIIILSIQWRNSKNKRKANEKLSEQKEKVEAALTELKSAQTQLIQREKMASLGELTAGIAHEIQNPLNFVNNFSELNNELLTELKDQDPSLKSAERLELLNDIAQNNEKIVLHGKRAESIVKGMLEHSKQSTGIKDLTDINKLTEEYLRLAYTAFVSKNKMFNIELLTHLEKTEGLKIFIAGQDIGRVLLNVLNNAFYAVYQRAKSAGPDYGPKIEITTFKKDNKIIFEVKDNGTGIPENIKDKIIQPFFTTKPTGEGTGLGLSLSYDIVVNGHGGTITWNSSLNEGSVFLITLPLQH